MSFRFFRFEKQKAGQVTVCLRNVQDLKRELVWFESAGGNADKLR
jgi:hypothetical protein